PREPGDFHPFRPVTGEGVFQIPVGPVHAGIIEPGHFRFGVAGEPVLYLQLRLFYVHKGTEKRFEKLPWRHGLFLAESISGDTAVGHALAYAHAVERLTGVEVPRRARYLRTVLLELERLYNHVADIGAIATDVAFAVPASRAQVLREGLVAIQERLFGARLLRGTVALCGVECELRLGRRSELLVHLDRLGREFDDLVKLLIDSGTFTDRVVVGARLGRRLARGVPPLGPDRRGRPSGAGQGHRPELQDLAGAGPGRPRQHPPRLPGDQQELQPVLLGQRPLGGRRVPHPLQEPQDRRRHGEGPFLFAAPFRVPRDRLQLVHGLRRVRRRMPHRGSTDGPPGGRSQSVVPL